MADLYISPEVQAVRALYADLLSHDYSVGTIAERLSSQALTLLEAHAAGNVAVTFQLACWCPDLISLGTEQIMAVDLSLEQARAAIAREHGYPDWHDIEAMGNTMLDPEFESSVDAVIHGDIEQLKIHLARLPGLVTQRSQYGHRASLLHYIGANGVESYRQITPMNAIDVTRTLIEAGADVNAAASIYGSSATRELVLSSAHPHNAGLAQAIGDVLTQAGAE